MLRSTNFAINEKNSLMNITEILKETDKPVLLQFYAEWCGPCKTLSKMIDDSITDITTHVALKRINVDEHPEISAAFFVRAIPTMVLVNQAGETKWKHTGVIPVTEIVSEITKA